jgi:hypothetical protein
VGQHHGIKAASRVVFAARPVRSVDRPIWTHPIRSRPPAAFVACCLSRRAQYAAACGVDPGRGAEPRGPEKKETVCGAIEQSQRGTYCTSRHRRVTHHPVRFPSTRRVRAPGAVISAYERPRSGGDEAYYCCHDAPPCHARLAGPVMWPLIRGLIPKWVRPASVRR